VKRTAARRAGPARRWARSSLRSALCLSLFALGCAKLVGADFDGLRPAPSSGGSAGVTITDAAGAHPGGSAGSSHAAAAAAGRAAAGAGQAGQDEAAAGGATPLGGGAGSEIGGEAAAGNVARAGAAGVAGEAAGSAGTPSVTGGSAGASGGMAAGAAGAAGTAGAPTGSGGATAGAAGATGAAGGSGGGTAGAGGAAGAAGGGNSCGTLIGPSCAGDPACNPAGETCCASQIVRGGSFYRGDGSEYPATVDDFCLDKYEVTVGRFRAFLDAYENDNWRPAQDAGKHPVAAEMGIEGTGWQGAWTSDFLPESAEAFKANLLCYSGFNTWREPAENDVVPINCVSWYEAFAFCIWDGGRLPTEAEWEYAAVGGSQQRQYPWGSGIDSSRAVYDCCGDGDCSLCTYADLLPVGSLEAGAGRWGQLDLAGNVWEWIFDGFADPYETPTCDNCVNTTTDADRATRGGGFLHSESLLVPANRTSAPPTDRYLDLGIRCARTPPG
jgi:sulfatase modifying factor 1